MFHAQLSKVEMSSVLFGDQFDLELVRATLVRRRSRKVIGAQLRICAQEHDDDMDIAPRDQSPEVVHRQRQRRLAGDVGVDDVLHAHFHVRSIDVAMKVLLAGDQPNPSVVVGNDIRVAIPTRVLRQTTVDAGTAQTRERNGLELVVDRVARDLRLQIS